ncbi:MAG TPA: hypothetical protein PK082_04140 [Phycisphaerae bacterium]|nr:hypothetical protein [Phycisphaerae bacterium]
MNKSLTILMVMVGVRFVCAGPAYTNTVTEAEMIQGPVVRTALTWFSGTNNDSVAATTVKYFRGDIKRIVFVPDATYPASTDFDVTLKDAAGVDILAGRGADISSNAVVNLVPGASIVNADTTNIVPFIVNDRLAVAITNCGNLTSGQIIIYTE